MRRNCAKLVTFVGTFPTSSSIACKCYGGCGITKTVSNCTYVGAINLRSSKTSNNNNGACQCSSSFLSYENDSNCTDINARKASEKVSSSYWRSSLYMQYLSKTESSAFNGVSSVGMWKPTPLSSLFLLRKCSTPGTEMSLHSSKRHYSGNRSKNVGDSAEISTMMDTSASSESPSPSRWHQQDNPPHLQNNGNENNDRIAHSTATNHNTQIQWSSHQHARNIDFSSTIINENKENVDLSPSSSSTSTQKVSSSHTSVLGGRLQSGCGISTSSSAGTNGSSSSSSSATSTVSAPSVFGMITTASACAAVNSFTPVRTVVTSQRLVEVTRDSIMEQPKLMSKEEREEFMSVYHQLVKELLEIPDMKDMAETNRWMARVLQYNVPHGKRNRGLSTALAYKYFAPEELTEENVRLSYVLGWCVEILQAFFLVADDIMDGSETRRGRPCWYKVDNLGLAAVNDALLLEATIYAIIRKHFNDKPYYGKVMEVMHDVTYKTIFGQSLDTRTGQDRRMETYTMERYSSIVKYKTSYYSFYLPVALAMSMCEITDPNLLQQMRKVTLEMGHFFQVQDDYLDCFGDEEVTGKIGTDIQDCKCSWMFVVANQMCTPEQKRFLMDNYGKHNSESIEAVKKLYKELGMEDVYHNYEEQTYNMICTHIQQMSDQMPKGLFYDMLHKIYKRSC